MPQWDQQAMTSRWLVSYFSFSATFKVLDCLYQWVSWDELSFPHALLSWSSSAPQSKSSDLQSFLNSRRLLKSCWSTTSFFPQGWWIDRPAPQWFWNKFHLRSIFREAQSSLARASLRNALTSQPQSFRGAGCLYWPCFFQFVVSSKYHLAFASCPWLLSRANAREFPRRSRGEPGR